jgi:oligosaccharide repeat unit polymerase
MILIPSIVLTIFFIYYQKKNKGEFGIISLLTITYLTTSILGAILFYSNLLISVYEISSISMLYLSSLILLTLLGFSPFKDYKINSLVIDNVQLFNLLEIFLLIGSILSIIFYAPHAIRAFEGDIRYNRMYLEETTKGISEYGLINSFASIFSHLFILTQMFAFINLIPKNGVIKKERSMIMFLASMSYIVQIFAYVGRDGVVFWLMSFIFQYLFFRKFLAKDIRKLIKKRLMVVFILLLIPFMIISIARFSASPKGVYFEIVNYMGQQLINFSDKFDLDVPLQMGNHGFPEFANFFRFIGFDIPMKMDRADHHLYYLDYQVEPWTFSTFIGSYLVDFGKQGTIIFIALFSLVTYRLTKQSIRYNSFPISNFILFILLYQIVYFGVFYNRLSMANFYMLAVILIYVVLKLKHKNSKSLILYR